MIGKNFFRQCNRAVIQPRAINGPQRTAEAQSRMSVGRGLRMMQGPNGIPLVSGLSTDTLVLCRITSAGMTARTGTAPDFTCGTGMVTRYTLDGATMTRDTVEEEAYNRFPVVIDGDRDAVFFEARGNLYIVVPNCTST